MRLNIRTVAGIAALAAILSGATIFAADAGKISLPKPATKGGKPLMQALMERENLRAFSPKEFSLQTVSDLFWAACGINRPESGKRTVPSAVNWQEISVYAAMEKGLYRYNEKENTLEQVLAQDIRGSAGSQAFLKTVPVVLIYVADYEKMGKGAVEQKDFYSAVDTGFISQNVYLFCASENLATVVMGGVDKKALAQVMKLTPEQKVMLTQPVGYPQSAGATK